MSVERSATEKRIDLACTARLGVEQDRMADTRAALGQTVAALRMATIE